MIHRKCIKKKEGVDLVLRKNVNNLKKGAGLPGNQEEIMKTTVKPEGRDPSLQI